MSSDPRSDLDQAIERAKKMVGLPALGPIIFSQAEALELYRQIKEVQDERDRLRVEVETLKHQVEKEHDVAGDLKDGLGRQFGEWAEALDARDAALAHVAELRGALGRVRDRVECYCHPGDGCSCAVGFAVAALNLTTSDALALQQARREVVEAVRTLFVDARKGDLAPLEYNLGRDGILAVDGALAALEKLEGGR